MFNATTLTAYSATSPLAVANAASAFVAYASPTLTVKARRTANPGARTMAITSNYHRAALVAAMPAPILGKGKFTFTGVAPNFVPGSFRAQKWALLVQGHAAGLTLAAIATSITMAGLPNGSGFVLFVQREGFVVAQ